MKNLFLAVSVFLASLAYGQDTSVKKLMKLAEKGDVQAQAELADAYFNGKGVNRSYRDAVVWLEKVAESGDAKAQYQLGQCYFIGQGVAKSEEKAAELKAGDVITVSLFEVGQLVDVTGTSKGKGFSGTIKRHNFGAQRTSHGNSRSHRVPGSIGMAQDPGRVFPGKRMAGQYGNTQSTVQHLEIVRVDEERNLSLIHI